jgi:prepilin-type processing-associated H-X9-DG protein
MLPYIEQSALYDQFKGNNASFPEDNRGYNGDRAPWDAPANTKVPVYACPSDPGAQRNGRGTTIRASVQLSMGDATRPIFPNTGNNRAIFSLIHNPSNHHGGNEQWGIISNFVEGQINAGIAQSLQRLRNEAKGISAVTDGTSNTIYCSEVTANDGETRSAKGGVFAADGSMNGTNTVGGNNETLIPNWCMNNAYEPGSRTMLRTNRSNGLGGGWRGMRPYDRHWNYIYFNTIIPPNGPACSRGGGGGECDTGLYPPQSYHAGGVNAAMVDGAVRFITDSINTNGLNGEIGGGQPNYAGPSVFGVWGALGSISGGDQSTL